MLRLNFRSVKGDAPTLTVAAFFKFCTDGTLRGPENYLVARYVDGAWQLNGRMHRELECEGPLHLRLNAGTHAQPKLLGPFVNVRTAAGMLYAGNDCLNIRVPGAQHGRDSGCQEVTLLSMNNGGSALGKT